MKKFLGRLGAALLIAASLFNAAAFAADVGSQAHVQLQAAPHRDANIKLASITLTGGGSPPSSGPAGVFLPALTTSGAAYKIVADANAKLMASYSGPIVNAYNVGATTNQDFSATSGQYVSKSALQSFEAASYLGTRKWYDQSGNGCDLTETTPGQMLQLYVDGAGPPSSITGRDLTKNYSDTHANTSMRKLLIPACGGLQRQNLTVFWIGRGVSAYRKTGFWEFGDLTTSAHADLALTSPGTYGSDHLYEWNAGTSTFDDHVKVDHFEHNIYPTVNIAVHELRTSTSETDMTMKVDDRVLNLVPSVTGSNTPYLDDQGQTFPALSMTNGGQLCAVGTNYGTNSGGFTIPSEYELCDVTGFIVIQGQINSTDHAAILAALQSVHKTITATTKSFVMKGDSITEGAAALYNQMLPTILADHLTTQDTMVHNHGITADFAHNNTTWFTDQNDSRGKGYQIFGGTNAAHIWMGINDIQQGTDSTATIEANLTAMVTNAHSAGYTTVFIGTLLPCGCLTGDSVALAKRTAVNTWIRGGGSGADDVVDYDADATMGSAGYPGNVADGTLYFSADQTHPTDFAYQTYLWPVLKARIIAKLGWTLS